MSKEINIAVDIGNSRIKSGEFLRDELKDVRFWEELEDLKREYPSHNRWIFSSVKSDSQDIRQLFGSQAIILDSGTPLPIQINYKTPDTLGMDRIAAAVGGSALFPGRNVLIIDLGSCINYDLVDNQATFQGGIISPGLRMRMKAMAKMTRSLPDISGEWETIGGGVLGKTTRECLLKGAEEAIRHEINGFLEEITEQYEELVVILTGGDAQHFETKLKRPIFADFNIVLKGLNRILAFNESK